MVLALLLQVQQLPTLPPDTAVWVALIMSGGGVVTAIFNRRRSTRHAKRIDKLEAKVIELENQIRRERSAVHAWWAKVITYLSKLPNGQEIVDGLPPMPVFGQNVKRVGLVSRFRVPHRPGRSRG